MKVKTNTYGVFYKDEGVWRGPFDTVVVETKKEKKSVKKAARATLKKKVRLLKQIWKS